MVVTLPDIGVTLKTLTFDKPIIVDADVGLFDEKSILRFNGFPVGGVIIGSVIGDDLEKQVKSISELPYSVEKKNKYFRIVFPLKYIKSDNEAKIEELVRVVREVLGVKIIVRVSATQYSRWISLVEAFSDKGDAIEMDFVPPFFLSEKHGFERLMIEIVRDAVSFSSSPILVRIPINMSYEYSKILDMLNSIGIEAVVFSGTYVRSQLMPGQEKELNVLTRSSELTDYIISVGKPWESPIPVGISTEIGFYEDLLRIFSSGFKIVESGFDLLLMGKKSALETLRKLEEKMKELGVSKLDELVKENKLFREHRRGITAYIDEDLCTTCNKEYLCVNACPYAAIETGISKPYVNEQKCSGCMFCVHVCPVNAIKTGFTVKIEELE